MFMDGIATAWPDTPMEAGIMECPAAGIVGLPGGAALAPSALMTSPKTKTPAPNAVPAHR
jgi:hypothetical protein